MSDEEVGIPKPEGDADVIQTEYEVGQDNKQILGLDFHNPVFAISAIGIMAFVFFTLIFRDSLNIANDAGEITGHVYVNVRDWLTSHLSWFFLLAGNIFVVVALGIVVSPLGKVRLGGTDATPDFSRASWFALLFAAGMGIGLMFFGVSEPISHYGSSFGGVIVGDDGVRTDWAPLGAAAGDELGSRRLGMAATIFHWGLHPWAIYAIVALSLALFAYNKGLPLTIRSIFYPILGERVWGWPGHVIDIFAVFATIFGLATSLGIGASQAGAGLQELFGIENTRNVQIILIAVITGIALISVVAGLDKGVRRLSEINMILAFGLLLFLMLAGGILGVITGFFANLGAYAKDIIPLSNPFGREDVNFSQGWTAFYWAWWISWSPFVGMFIARVSRGRTVREFILAVLIVPSLVSVLWMTTFGGVALNLTLNDGVTAITEAALPLKLFAMLDQLPIAAITSFVGIILVIVFFVTSSDSGSLVIDTITAGGKVNAPTPQRIFWAVFEGLLAISLLIAGALDALQAGAVATGFPFAIILLFATYALIKGLLSEPRG